MRTPAPSFDHQPALQLFHRIIADYLDREPVDVVFIAPADVTLSQRRGVRPDLLGRWRRERRP
jgi:hypothetical protein